MPACRLSVVCHLILLYNFSGFWSRFSYVCVWFLVCSFVRVSPLALIFVCSYVCLSVRVSPLALIFVCSFWRLVLCIHAIVTRFVYCHGYQYDQARASLQKNTQECLDHGQWNSILSVSPSLKQVISTPPYYESSPPGLNIITSTVITRFKLHCTDNIDLWLHLRTHVASTPALQLQHTIHYNTQLQL